jgi:hypothetical protein
MPYIANPLEGIPLVNTFITDQALLGTTPATDDVLIIYDQSATALKQMTISELQDSITNTISGATDTTITSVASGEVLKWNGSVWINQTLAEANILPVAGPTFTGVITVGSAVLSEADLEQIDDLTAGTAVASKALVVDGNKDIGTLRNLTIDGTFSDGNYTFDTSGNVSGLGTIGSGNITSTGTVQGTTITATTAFVPDASDGAALGTASLEFSDLFLADAAVISLGDDDDVTLTHVIDTGILLSSTDRFQFGDAGTFIHQSADGVLTIESDTTVDINGAVVFDGALTGITNVTISGTLSDGNYTFDTDGNVTGLGTIASGTHTIGTLVVAAASITDTSGALSFGNENLTTTGTLAAGTTTIGTLTVAAASITDSSGALSFGNENLTTTGTLAAGTTTIGTLVVAAASITDTSGSISFGDDNITTTGTTTTGNLTVTGTTTTVDTATLSVEDPLIILASGNNAGDAVDIGFYGLYDTSGTQDIYAGLFRDASDSGKWKLFHSLQPAPTTTVNVVGTGYTVGTLVANLEGNATGTAATVTTAAQPAITSVAVALTQGTLTTGSGSITDSSGAITFGNENLSTTGTLAAGTTTIGTLTVAAASITDSSGALSFGNENLTTTGTLNAGAITSSGVVTGTAFTAGSAVLAEAELELLDELTAGTAIASKVVTTDASIDTTGQRNLTITGELDAGSLDISGIADIAGAVDLHATLDMNTNDIDNARSITFIAEVDNGDSSTSDTIDWGAGQKQKTTMTGNCTYTFTAPDGPCNLMLSCYQDGTARTITWPSTVKWPAATAPTFTGTNNIRDIVAFYYDGTHYFGQATLNFPA